MHRFQNDFCEMSAILFQPHCGIPAVGSCWSMAVLNWPPLTTFSHLGWFTSNATNRTSHELLIEFCSENLLSDLLNPAYVWSMPHNGLWGIGLICAELCCVCCECENIGQAGYNGAELVWYEKTKNKMKLSTHFMGHACWCWDHSNQWLSARVL